MLISIQKPIDEIKKAVAPYGKLAIFGCGGCAAVCQSGGTKQVEELAHKLDTKEIIFTFQIDEPCDQRILKRELLRVNERMEQVEAVLALACGIGVQLIAESVGKPCITGLNTLFAGAAIHSTRFLETCNACGECVLNTTAAICPRTLCPKGISAGPCSEKTTDKCSVNENETCVWLQIAERKEALKITDTDSSTAPFDWAAKCAPRRIPINEASSAKTKNDHGKNR